MILASACKASTPVSPTTAAMAPNAPIGATHITIDKILNTRRCRCPIPTSSGSPRSPSAWIPKPTSSATNTTSRTSPEVTEEKSVVEMMPSRKPGSRMHQVADDGADRKCDRGHEQEVAEGEPADLPDARHLADRSDPEDQRAEDDRSDHHLDQGDEPVSERLEVDGKVRKREPHSDAQQDRGDDSQVEIVRAVPGVAVWFSWVSRDVDMSPPRTPESLHQTIGQEEPMCPPPRRPQEASLSASLRSGGRVQ